MTENVKSIIMRHRKVLLSDDVKLRFQLSERDIASAATLPELDEAYTRRVHNFGSVSEMYEWSSSINYISNIKHSMIYINSKDDPIVPDDLLTSIRGHASKFIYVRYCLLVSSSSFYMQFFEPEIRTTSW